MRSSRSSTEAFDPVSEERDPWQDLLRQELVQDAARRLNVDSAAVRPCFARISAVAQGNRNNTSFMYATELRRMGVSEHEGWREHRRWNATCTPPLFERELQNAFESAYRGEKRFGCRGALATSWCIGREKCDWFKQNISGRRKCRETDLWDYGWPAVLKSRETLVYLALVRLEQAKGVGAGGLLIAGMREYAALSGVQRSHVGEALTNLEQWKLLTVVERGQRRGAGLPPRACQVRRVTPIPEPPIALANRRRAAACA